jgi:hypothetical protein
MSQSELRDKAMNLMILATERHDATAPALYRKAAGYYLDAGDPEAAYVARRMAERRAERIG